MLGSLIGAGASLLGGILGQQNQSSINAQNIAAQEQINSQNIAMQKEFAQNGVQWKVADAKAAGINPLAALGASTSSFSNVVAPQASASNDFGKGVASMGQDISRALKDTMAAGDQHNLKMAQLTEVHGELENQLLASQIAKNNSAGAGGPPTPAGAQRYRMGLDGQGALIDLPTAVNDPSAIKVKPADVTPMTSQGVAAGVNPMTGFVKNGDYLYPVLSDSAAKAMSNDSLGNLKFRIVNELGLGAPPGEAEEGKTWDYMPGMGWYKRNVIRPRVSGFLQPAWMRE